ncbi:MAG TPA: hypothetical protein VGX92_20925 [Pyrinomonadaceae bacterium]|jgi:hypothetical protein|nr:hypothetical protein [Pyrinomonadaceae bacterium]
MPQQNWRKRFAGRAERTRSAYLLAAAAILHLSVTVLINLTGRFDLPPHIFDRNGISRALALDSFTYRRKSIELVSALAGGNLQDWLSAPFPLHVKLYSLSFALLSPVFGFSMLSVEPLNLFYYVSIIVLVYKTGLEVMERRAAIVAALVVACWPSLLLHTTQLLRDPLLIAATLLIVLVGTRWLTRRHTLGQGLLSALAAGAASAVVWVTRYNMWEILILFTLTGAVLLIARQLRERGWLTGNLLSAALLLLMLGGIPTVVGTFMLPDAHLNIPEAVELPPTPPCPDEMPGAASAPPLTAQSGLWARLMARADAAVLQLGQLRWRYTMFYADAGSNMDACVRLSSLRDLLNYLPRAVAHGFLAPYPSMWITSGSMVGRSGRILSGVEMVGMYVVEALAVVGLWSGRRRLPVWFIAVVALTGIIALGLVAVNMGVLFRLRYVFAILLVILGSGGALEVLSWWDAKRRERAKASAQASA